MNNITAEEVQASIIELLEAKQKNGTISSAQEEACYLAGAIQAIHLVYGDNPDALDSVPPAWVFAPMTGRSVNDYNYDK
jgi:hypothetical protein